jgi:hypothetical protein
MPSFYPPPYVLPTGPPPPMPAAAAAMLRDTSLLSRHDVPQLEFESRFESGNLHRAIQVLDLHHAQH